MTTIRTSPGTVAAATAGAMAMALSLVACGGSGPSRPKPLSHTVDEVALVKVPLEKRDALFKAQLEHTRAKARHQKAEADIAEAKSMLQVAKNELEQAKLEEESAAEKRKAAEASNDMNQINPAMKAARIAELSRRAADERIGARKAHIKYLEKFELYAIEEVYHQEARLEQTKAKLARDNDIKPKGFTYGDYESQAQDRSRRSQRAKADADKELTRAEKAKDKWKQALEQVRGARGESL